MHEIICRAIALKCEKLFKLASIRKWQAEKHAERFAKRTSLMAGKPNVIMPSSWQTNPHFNPHYCMTHKEYIARTIWKKLQEGTYEPAPAILYEIPKENGTKRQVMSFSIPDTIVSNIFFRRLTDRNKNFLSPFCYSYRNDKNFFDAVLHLNSCIDTEKVFVIQYDFKKFFDNFHHEYILNVIESNTFLITELERKLIFSFLTHKYASESDYRKNIFEKKSIGTPQGSSISLFLANIVAWDLDKKLEKRNGQFARFADDVVCITYLYQDAIHIAKFFYNYCKQSKLDINREKSPGIYLLEDPTKGEISSIDNFDFLGHKFWKNHIGMSDKGINRIKRKISRIIHRYLILYPKNHGIIYSDRIESPKLDWDIVTCLNEIRRYIYGGLKHHHLESFIEREVRLYRIRGLMSFYPLITAPTQLRKLDGWIVDVLKRALVERNKVLSKFDVNSYIYSKDEIISGSWYKETTIVNDPRCPSFVYAWRAARKHFIKYGLKYIDPPQYYSDY